MFHKKGYSYSGGFINVTLATVIGVCAGFGVADFILPSELSPEQFGVEAAPFILLGASICGGPVLGLEMIRWHYARS